MKEMRKWHNFDPRNPRT